MHEAAGKEHPLLLYLLVLQVAHLGYLCQSVCISVLQEVSADKLRANTSTKGVYVQYCSVTVRQYAEADTASYDMAMTLPLLRRYLPGVSMM